MTAAQTATVRVLTGRRTSRFRSGDALVLAAFLILAAIVVCALIPTPTLAASLANSAAALPPEGE